LLVLILFYQVVAMTVVMTVVLPVMKAMSLTVLMMIAVQLAGLVMALLTVKNRHMAVT
jgi:hypothetical protein